MKPILTVALSEDNGQPRLDWTTATPEQPLAARHVDSLIQALARLRQTLAPEVRPDSPEGQQVLGVVDPRWFIQRDATTTDGAVLMARHPGVGWLAYALPLASLKHLHGVMGDIIKQAELASPGSNTLN